MKVKIVIATAFTVLLTCGSVFSSLFYRSWIETNIASKIEKQFAISKISNVRYVVDLTDVRLEPKDDTADLNLANKALEKLRAANVLMGNSSPNQAMSLVSAPSSGEQPVVVKSLTQPSLKFVHDKKNKQISVEGILPDEDIATELLLNIKSSVGAQDIANKVNVQELVADPWWSKTVGSLISDSLSLSNSVSIELVDGLVKISAEAKDEVSREKLERKTRIFAGEQAKVEINVALAPRPTNFTLSRQGNLLLLQGRLPDEETRNAIVTAASESSHFQLSDACSIEKNAEQPWWSSLAARLCREFPNSVEGEFFIEFRQNSVELRGLMPSKEFQNQIKDIVEKSKPSTARATYSFELPKPATLHLSSVSGAIVLDGVLRSQKELEELQNIVRLGFPNTEFKTMVKINKNVSEAEWIKLLSPLITHMGPIAEPQLMINGTALELSGEVASADQIANYSKYLEFASSGDLSVTNALIVPPRSRGSLSSSRID